MNCTTIRSSIFISLLIGSVDAGIGVGTVCCNRALKEQLISGSYLNKTVPRNNYICGRGYQSGFSAVADFAVNTSWVCNNCDGYELSAPGNINEWATPLTQYILPAVIFSMTIPRRLVLDPPRWFFNFHLNHLNSWPKALFSLIAAGVIVTVDTSVWIFMIMVAPGPFIFSGLIEAVLDYSVIRNLNATHTHRGQDYPMVLDRAEKTELLTAVIAGNLNTKGIPADTQGIPANPQKELKEILNIYERPEEVEVRLRAMLDCQYPFGAAVGAPILLYIGSFAYSLVTIHNAEGDHFMARALAFGIWWMNIVHVAAISGCLLASNNPSTAAGFVKRRRLIVSNEDRLTYANDRSEMEDRIQARLETWSRLRLTYKARYEPVWMWSRGKSVASWLRHTTAWGKPWFREKVEVTIQGWICLIAVSYALILLPCALAFWIEYNTPPIGIACRALTILLYTVAQFIFVVLSAWSHFKAAQPRKFWIQHTCLNYMRRPAVGLVVAMIFLLPSWLMAIFTTFAGTLMQISGIFQNCRCASTGFLSHSPTATVSLATDTQSDRDSSRSWKRAGYTALIFLACVTYLGWWGQRYLREKSIERVKYLVPEHDDLIGNTESNEPDHGTGETESLEIIADVQDSARHTIQYGGLNATPALPPVWTSSNTIVRPV